MIFTGELLIGALINMGPILESDDPKFLEEVEGYPDLEGEILAIDLKREQVTIRLDGITIDGHYFMLSALSDNDREYYHLYKIIRKA
jgi:hypothetical protein